MLDALGFHVYAMPIMAELPPWAHFALVYMAAHGPDVYEVCIRSMGTDLVLI